MNCVDKVCKCGTSWQQVQKYGQLGCPLCYVIFHDMLVPVLEKCQYSCKHNGKVIALYKLKYDIIKLEKDMFEAAKNEEYELAAEIRDRLKSLKS